MFSTRKRIMLLHLSGNVIRTTADHPFDVHGQGWTDAADLQQGDKLRTHDSNNVTIDAITDSGEEQVVCQMDAGTRPFPCTGLWPAGTLIPSATDAAGFSTRRSPKSKSSARTTRGRSFTRPGSATRA